MLLKVHKDNPQPRHISTIVECLRDGGLVIYPTDTVYALGCDINSKKATERLCQIKGIKPEKAQLSCICGDLKILAEYSIHVTTPIYKLLKRTLPGPYTYILQASKMVPRHYQSSKKTIGIRITDHKVPLALVEALGNPIASSSLPHDEELEYYSDPELIYERFGKQVDIVVDSGYGGIGFSTIIDCSLGEDDMEVTRVGIGDPNVF